MDEAIEFNAGGTILRGRLFKPDGASGRLPGLILQGGLGSISDISYEHGRRFASHGFAVLLFDHKYSGRSDGEPRQLFDPWQQTRDLRHALTYMTLREDVDPDRIGLWGISIGGANCLFVAAMDRRVAALVALIPPVSGESARRLHDPAAMARFEDMIYEDRTGQMQGQPARLILTHGGPGDEALFTDDHGTDFVKRRIEQFPHYRNEMAIATLDYLFEMEVRAYAERIRPPLLLVLAAQDTVAPVEEALEMYARIPEPKQKISYPGQHYEILSRHMPDIAQKSVEFFTRELGA